MSHPQDPRQPGHPHNPASAPPQPGGGQPAGQPHQPQWAPQSANSGGQPTPAYQGAPQMAQNAHYGQPPQNQYPQGPNPYPNPHGQKPPKQKKPIFRRWWFWLIVVIVVIALINAISGGGGDTAEDTSSSSSQGGEVAPAEEQDSADDAPAEEKPAEEEPAEEKPAEYGLGDTAAADGWEITVSDVEDGISTVGSEYLNTEAQGQFVKVSLAVKNTTSEPQYFFEDNIKLGDDAGNSYSSDSEAGIYADEDSILFLEEINPGNTAEGVLVFDVPEDVSPDRLTFEGGIFSDPVEISLK